MRLIILLLCGLFLQNQLKAQALGGSRAMQFLRLSQSAHQSGMGGMVVSNNSNDLSLAMHNPALLRRMYNNQLALSHNFYYAGSTISSAYYASYAEKYKTMLAGGVSFLNYGSFAQTNMQGQNIGSFNASDYQIYVQMCRDYLTKWRYGLTLKLANSQLGPYKNSALLMDGGLVYSDTTNQFYFGAVAKSIGATLRRYNPNQIAEPLPIDVQIGFTKKLLKAPIRLSAIAHTLPTWDIRYANPADAQNSILIQSDTNKGLKKYTVDKIFRHANFNVDLVLSKNFEINLGYCHRRRKELAYLEKQGIVGYSYGAFFNFKKLQVSIARSHYHISGAYNELSLVTKLGPLFGIGK